MITSLRFSWLGETFDLKRTMDLSNELWASFIKDYKSAAEAHKRETKERRYALLNRNARSSSNQCPISFWGISLLG